MAWYLRWIVSLLVWLSADTERLSTEPARAAAAVAAARSAIVGEARDLVGVEAVPTPKFNSHAEKCRQCKNRNPRGPGLCEEGFRLLQEDLMDSKKTCTTGTCPSSIRAK